MSVCLRKLPKIGLSVVPCALRAISIPLLRSGTATLPLLSLPYVRFICFADSAHVANLRFANEFLQCKNSQLYTQNSTAYIQLFYYIKNIAFYQNLAHFYTIKNTEVFVPFSSKFCKSNLYVSSRNYIFCNVITKATGLFL